MANGHNRTTSLISPRGLLIKSLEERYAKYPTPESVPPRGFGEPGRFEALLGLTERNTFHRQSSVPNVVYFHPTALGSESWPGIKKKHGEIRFDKHPLWDAPKQTTKLYK